MFSKINRISAFLLLISMMFLLSVTSASAQTTSVFAGNIDGTEPESFEVDNSTCTIIETLFHYYEAYEFYVTATGDYDYTDLSIFYDLDMQLTIYTNSYNPTSVLDNCVTRFDDSGTFTLVEGQQYIFVVQPLFDASFNTGDWEFEMDGPGEVILGSLASEETEPAFIPLDDRINRFDAAAPIAVYVNSEGGVDIYTINGSDGVFLFRTTTLTDAPCDGSLIATQSDVAIYRGTDCTYQINAPQYNGKTYVLRFDNVASQADYVSYEE